VELPPTWSKDVGTYLQSFRQFSELHPDMEQN